MCGSQSVLSGALEEGRDLHGHRVGRMLGGLEYLQEHRHREKLVSGQPRGGGVCVCVTCPAWTGGTGQRCSQTQEVGPLLVRL